MIRSDDTAGVLRSVEALSWRELQHRKPPESRECGKRVSAHPLPTLLLLPLLARTD